MTDISIKKGTLSTVVDDHITFHLPLIDDIEARPGFGDTVFTRPSIATYIDKDDGILKTALSGVPRFENDGYLSESTSTNIQLHSSDQSNATYNKAGVSVTTSPFLSPDNINYMSRVTEDVATTNHIIYDQYTSLHVIGTYFCFSFFIKKNLSAIRGVRVTVNGLAPISFMLNPSTMQPMVANTAESYTIDSIGNDIYKVSLAGVITDDLETPDHHVYLTEGVESSNTVYTGTTGYVDMWGWQVENKLYPTSYISTDATAETRLKDTLLGVFKNNHVDISAGNAFSVSMSARAHNVETEERTLYSGGFKGVNDSKYSLLRITSGTSDIHYHRSGELSIVETGDVSFSRKYNITISKNELITTYSDTALVTSEIKNLFYDGSIPEYFGIGCDSLGGTQLDGHIKDFTLHNIDMSQSQVTADDATTIASTIKQYYDFEWDENGDIAHDNSLDTAIILSLFDEVRADESEVAPAEFRRGWLGNEINQDDFEQGSKLWEFEQARITGSMLSDLGDVVRISLEHFVTDGLASSIDVKSPYLNNGRIMTEITFFNKNSEPETRFFELWNNTGNF